jgi:hypothetical protein
MSIQRKVLTALVVTLTGALWSAEVSAQTAAPAAGPFAGFAGSWSGTGTVRLQNGTSERLRCDAGYQVAPSGTTLHQSLRCRSDSFDVNLQTTLLYQNGAASGTWLESVKQAQGRISGQMARGQLQAVAQGPGFTANLAVALRGDQQTVTIRSQGNDSTQVAITLRRAGGAKTSASQ